MRHNCMYLFLAALLWAGIAHGQNPTLQHIWSHGVGKGKAYAVKTDNNGNVIAAGYFEGTIDFDPGPGTYTLTNSTTGSDLEFFVAKYDAGGNFIWAINDAVAQDNEIYSVDVDANGNIYASGRDADDIMFMKIDPNGNILWRKRFLGTAGNERAWKIKVDTAGDIYMCGHFAFTTDFDASGLTYNLTGTSTGGAGFDIFYGKFSSNGDPVWVKNLPVNGNSLDRTSMTLDKTGAILLTGYFSDGPVDFDPSGATANLGAPGGPSFVFFAKYDNNGNYIWARHLASSNISGQVFADDIAADSSCNIFITGTTYDSTDFDPGAGTYISNTTSGAFLAKYDSSGSLAWAHKISNTNEGYGIDINSAQDIIWCGNFGNFNTGDFDPGTGTVQLSSQPPSNVFVAKYTNTGFFNYVYALEGGVGEEYTYDVDFDLNDNVVVVGMASDGSDFDFSQDTALIPSLGASDIFFAKYRACYLDVSATYTNVSCNGDADGAIDLTVNGQTGIYTYSWSNVQSNQDISGLNGGVYSYTVTESNGCKDRNSITINEPAVLSATYVAVNENNCGDNDGSITLSTVSGGTTPYTYTWNNAATTASLVNLAAGNYSVTIADSNNCVFTETFVLTCTGTSSVKNIYAPMIKVFPNPAATGGEITVYTAQPTDEIVLMTLNGQKINTRSYKNGNETHISISNVVAGIFLLQVTTGQQHYYIKLVIE